MNNIIEILKGMWRNFTMTFASVILVTLTLLVVGFVCMISFNTRHISKELLDSLQIYAYVDPTISSQDKLDNIQKEVTAIDGVSDVVFSSKDEELELLADGIGESGDDVIEYFSGDSNPLSDLFIVAVDENNYDISAINKQVEEIDGIESSSYGAEAGANNFIKTMKIIEYFSILVALALIVVSIFIITNTIKLTIASRRKEIEIMRLVGATKAYIRFPFMFEGMLIGLIGGVLSFLMLDYLYVEAFNANVFSIFQLSMITPQDMQIIIAIILPIGGMLIGIIGAFFATMKYLKK